MKVARRIGGAVIVALALAGAYFSGLRLLSEYRLYRAQQLQTYIMWTYFTAGTGVTAPDPKTGEVRELSRGDLLGEMGRQFAESSKAAARGQSQNEIGK